MVELSNLRCIIGLYVYYYSITPVIFAYFFTEPSEVSLHIFNSSWSEPVRYAWASKNSCTCIALFGLLRSLFMDYEVLTPNRSKLQHSKIVPKGLVTYTGSSNNWSIWIHFEGFGPPTKQSSFESKYLILVLRLLCYFKVDKIDLGAVSQTSIYTDC